MAKVLKCTECGYKMHYNDLESRWECDHCSTVAYASKELSEDPDDIIWDDDYSYESAYGDESLYDQMMEDND